MSAFPRHAIYSQIRAVPNQLLERTKSMAACVSGLCLGARSYFRAIMGANRDSHIINCGGVDGLDRRALSFSGILSPLRAQSYRQYDVSRSVDELCSRPRVARSATRLVSLSRPRLISLALPLPLRGPLHCSCPFICDSTELRSRI